MQAAAIAVSLISIPAVALPRPSSTFEKLLIPVFLQQPLPGAFGSSWATDFWISNGGDAPVDFGGGIDFGCSFPPCPPDGARLNPGVTFRPRVLPRPDGLQGTFVLADARYSAALSFALRFRDLSRQSQTWGSEIPVIREGEFRPDKLFLVDIPLTEGFRQILRVYSLVDDGTAAFVRVRAFRIRPEQDLPAAPPDDFLGEGVFQLQFISPGFPSGAPGYLAIFDLGMIARVAGVERIRLEIEPATQGLRLWAFVTVVNNETQHATVITPQ